MVDKTVLDGKAKDILAAIKPLSRADLEQLLEWELAGARRATVIDFISRRNLALQAAERKALSQ